MTDPEGQLRAILKDRDAGALALLDEVLAVKDAETSQERARADEFKTRLTEDEEEALLARADAAERHLSALREAVGLVVARIRMCQETRERWSTDHGGFFSVSFPEAEWRALLAAHDAAPAAQRLDREALGRKVREVWVAWAREQPAPKPSWLVPWDGLSEPDKEVDRRIGETLAALGTSAPAASTLTLEEVEGVLRSHGADLGVPLHAVGALVARLHELLAQKGAGCE